MDQKLTVRVISPKEILFSGEALSVSSKNSKGNFDILPYHARFISFIENQPIIINTIDNQKKTFKFPFAIISHQDNKVDIYTEIGIEKINS